MTFEKLEKILAEMTPGKWHGETSATGPMVFFSKANRVWEECLVAPYVPSGINDAKGIAALRNLAPLLLEVCKAAESLLNAEKLHGYRQFPEPWFSEFQTVSDTIAALKAALADRDPALGEQTKSGENQT